MAYTVKDEGMHPYPEPTPEAWQESCVVSWRDPEIGISANLHMGCEIGRGLSNVMVGVYSDTGCRYYYNADDLILTKVPKEEGHGLCSGPLTVVHDGEHLRAIVETSECRVNLIIEDLFDDRVSPVGHDNDFAEQVAKNHFNVECRVRGSVDLGNNHFQVNGYGHRDHSWGPRTFEAGKSVVAYRWLAGGVKSGMTFSLYSLVTAEGSFARHGWVRINGERHDVSHTTVIQLMEDGISPHGAQTKIDMPDGNQLTIDYVARGAGLMSVRELHNVMSMGDITCSDGQIGYATLEYVESVTQGVKAPVFSQFIAIENGLSEAPAK